MNAVLRGLAGAAIALCAAATHAQDGRLYTPGPFDRLNISGIAKVELAQGLRDEVFVLGDEAAQRNVQLTLQGNRLSVETEDGWKFWSREPVQLRVQMRELTQLAISGASDIVAPRPIKAKALHVNISGKGSVQLADLQAQSLRFDISGAGDGEVAGQVDEMRLRVSGKGKLLAERLNARRSDIIISGIGNADVWVTEELRIVISGIGTVNYWGQPRVVRSSSGMSDVTAKGDKR